MIQAKIHKRIVEKCNEVCDWFESESSGLCFPFYSSFDIRDSGEKVCPVDANIYPAGFNNICQQDKDSAEVIAKNYLQTYYGDRVKSIALVTEEHTQNPYYWDNVLSISNLLKSTGREVLICFPREMEKKILVRSSTGESIEIQGLQLDSGAVATGKNKIDLIISNNDFSILYEVLQGNKLTPVNPPVAVGWHTRTKGDFFSNYNELAVRFAEVIDITPGLITIETERFGDFHINEEESREALAEAVDQFIGKLTQKYKELGIDQKPFAFVKNDSGTYGLAVIKAESGDEVRQWNYKSKKRMKASKGGREVQGLIIQEGIPTRFRDKDENAEPCIYTIGSELVGGFLRSHSKKGPDENLNSPGAVYKKLCMSDLEVELEDCPMENVYGWLSKLGVLSVAREIKKAGVRLKL